MKLQLLFKNNIIHEIEAEAITEIYVIGRSNSCDLVTPREDAMISSQHAEIYRKNKALWLRDKNSTNNTFYADKPVKEIKLRPGMELIMGHCILLVKESTDRNKTKQKLPARLLIRSGSSKGRDIMLGDCDIRIGTAADCQLLLDDRTVSKLHAVVHVRSDESCWISDRNSLNGTRINGDKLPQGKERMLRGGDEIEIGSVILGFIPAGLESPTFHVAKFAAVLIATLIFGIGSYWGYKFFVYPSAELLLDQARQAASREDFSVADQLLSQTEFSYDYHKHENIISHMRNALLPQWMDTLLRWKKAQKSLNEEDLEQAAKILGQLVNRPANAWTWSNQSHVFRSQCIFAHELIQCHYLLLERNQDPTLDLKNLERNLQRSIACLDIDFDPPDYLNAVIDDVTKRSTAQKACLTDWNNIWKSLDKLRWASTGLDAQLSRLERALSEHDYTWPAQTCLPSVALRRCDVKQALSLLKKRYHELLTVLSSVKEKQFVQAASQAKQLTDAMDSKERQIFAVHPRFTEISTQLRVSAENAMHTIGHFHTKLEQAQNSFAKWGSLLVDKNGFADRSIQQQLLEADCLPLPYGQRLDSSFHRFLGLDTFYNFIKGHDSLFPEETAIYKCRKLAADTEQLLQFFTTTDRGGNLDWLQNLMQEDLLLLQKNVLRQRDHIIGMFLDHFESKTGRERVIAGGVAMALATDSCHADLQNRLKVCRAEIGQTIKELDVELSKLDSAFAFASPEQQVKIILEIMAKGIPGHPLIRKTWPKRDSLK